MHACLFFWLYLTWYFKVQTLLSTIRRRQPLTYCPAPSYRAVMAKHNETQPSKYSRPLDTDNIGSRSRLPRGRQRLDKDPEFFRSVHLVGEGLAREKEEAKRRAEELWRSKVLVLSSCANAECANVKCRSVACCHWRG